MCEISIITPAYNSREYIAQTIESVLNQNFEDLEHIIIDDGSTDSTPEIIKKYALNNSKIKYIRKQNEGQGVARNYAMGIAKGKYILFLDSDDWLNSADSLKKLYDKIEQEDCDILFFNYIRNYQEEARTVKIKFIEPFYSHFKGKSFKPIEAKEILFKTNGLPFKIYKRDFLINNEINYSKLRFIEDSEFYIKAILCAKKIGLLDKNIVNYRVHKASTTFKIYENIETIRKVFYICEDIFKKYKLDETKEHLTSFMENRISQMLSYYKMIDNSQKKEYYKMMKPIIQYIDTSYDIDIKNNILKDRYNKILKYNQMQFNLITKINRTKILLKSNI